MEYFVIIIGSIFVSNIVLTQFLGICPFVGVSGKLSTSVGMGGAVLFVLTLATMVTWIDLISFVSGAFQRENQIRTVLLRLCRKNDW